MFSGAIKLADIDDYINPNKDCIFYIFNIELLNSQITCYLYGPKNYIQKFNSNTKFTNLVPGVYIILGDEKELEELSLYQNETRLDLQKNTTKNIFLEFNSYETVVSIKDR